MSKLANIFSDEPVAVAAAEKAKSVTKTFPNDGGNYYVNDLDEAVRQACEEYWQYGGPKLTTADFVKDDPTCEFSASWFTNPKPAANGGIKATSRYAVKVTLTDRSDKAVKVLRDSKKVRESAGK